LLEFNDTKVQPRVDKYVLAGLWRYLK